MNREIKIGLSVIVAILLLYLSIAWVKRVHLFAPEENVYAVHFFEVSGLQIGDPVVIRGFPAGRVLEINPTNDNVIVQISLDKRFTPKKDANAEVRLKELMGSKQLFLNLGSTSEILPNSEPIPGSSALDFGSGFSRISAFLDSTSPDDVSRFIRRIDSMSYQMNRLLFAVDPQEIRTITQNLSTTSQHIARLTADAEQKGLVAKVDQSLNNLGELLQITNKTLINIDSLTLRLHSQSLPLVENTLSEFTDLSREAQESIAELQSLLKQLQTDQTVANKLLYDSEFGSQIETAVSNLNAVLEQINNDKIYISFGKNKNAKNKQ